MKSVMLFLLLLLTICLMTPRHADAADGYSSYRAARGLHIASYPTLIVAPAIGIGVASAFDNGRPSTGKFLNFAASIAIGLGVGLASFPMHLSSSLWAANALRKQGHDLSRTAIYTAWGFLGAGSLMALVGGIGLDDAGGVIAIGLGALSWVIAGILSCAQWVANGKQYRGRPEPTSLTPLRLQFSAQF